VWCDLLCDLSDGGDCAAMDDRNTRWNHKVSVSSLPWLDTKNSGDTLVAVRGGYCMGLWVNGTVCRSIELLCKAPPIAPT
jgi:hypothetical protein